jgi:hypothetical protein
MRASLLASTASMRARISAAPSDGTAESAVPGATRTSRLLARSRRVPARTAPPCSTTSIQASSALMNASAGAPCSICRARVELEANENRISGKPACRATARKASLRLAAANTTAPSSAARDGGAALANGAAINKDKRRRRVVMGLGAAAALNSRRRCRSAW